MSAPEGLTPLKRALLAIDRLQARVQELESKGAAPLAVIGMACRFPGGAHDPEQLHAFLMQGGDAVRERPSVDRPGWDAAEREFGPFPPAAYLDIDVTSFDAAFFGISPREAASIDPQQRLLLEVAWEALENAAIDPRGLEGSRTGVFVGITGSDYAQMQAGSERALELFNTHYAAGIGHSMASGRISYLLGLQGPAITVDTACSSSLTAVHLACSSLRAGECDIAIAAGTNLILTGDSTLAYRQSRMLAPDGRCKTFADTADGFGRGEGCGVVVLKRLDQAGRAGDRILAVVRACVSNQDGPSSGLTAPNGPAQEALIREALAQARLTPADIGYIETHGTGTSLGDPIEVQALGAVFAGRPADAPVVIGSIKTNMAHLEATAGIAGFIKAVQALRHRAIPPHLHFTRPSSHIPWERYPLQVPVHGCEFPLTGGARRAGVSAFGFSGTNVHVILEEAKAPPLAPPGDREPERALHVLPLSAADEAALTELARRFADHLGASGDPFPDICHTAAVGRAHLRHRLAVMAADADQAALALSGWLETGEAPGVRRDTVTGPDRPRIAFLYTGQGAQYPGMAWRLYHSAPVFRAAVLACDELLREHLEVPLIGVLDPDGPHAQLVGRTDYTQPALFAVQYGLTELWRSWGIRPDVVLGHSIGEFAAAHAAGVFSLADVLRLVAARGRLMHAVTTPGRMLAVMAPESVVAGLVDAAGGTACIAAINSPVQVVVSGEVAGVGRIEEAARAAGIETRPVRTSHAFHSHLMDGAVGGLADVLRGLELRAPAGVRFVSTVTGTVVGARELTDPEYWARQLRRPVRFADALATAAGLAQVALEVGPHPALAALASQGDVNLPVLPSLQREREDWPMLLQSLAGLYVRGANPDWAGFDAGRTRRRLELPLYPFQRGSHWVDLGSGRREGGLGGHPLLGCARSRPGTTREFERTLRVDAPAFIAEHRVLGQPLLPGTAYVEMALAAGRTVLGGDVVIEGIDLLAPMAFSAAARRVHLAVEPEGARAARVEIHSADATRAGEASWTRHAAGRIALAERTRAPETVALSEVQARCGVRQEAAAFYRSMGERGYDFGPRLQGVQEIHIGQREALARIALPAACAEDRNDYHAHPLLLDAALQVVGPALGEEAGAGTAFLPTALERIAAYGPADGTVWAHARITGAREGTCTADVRLLDVAGRVLVEVGGAVFRAVRERELAGAAADDFLRVVWEPAPAEFAAERPAVGTAALAAATAETLRTEASRERAAEYDAYVEQLEQQSGTYVVHAFRQLGWEPAPGQQATLDGIAAELGVVPERQRLLARSLGILAEEGILEADGARWQVLRPLPDLALPATLVGAPADLPPEQLLLERCAPHLADMLRGRGDPLELLFPGGDSSLAERMYHDTAWARTFNRSVVQAVRSAIASVPAGQAVRIFEVGGGTGGTTRGLVEALLRESASRERSLEYTFTDVSPLFVERARARYGAVDGMRFRTFDLDREPEDQGLQPGSYDIVVAANCLHAARDLGAALRRTGALLVPGGTLVAVEVFAPFRCFDLTVGLTDGWWHFTDPELRGGYPCVPPDTWSRVLRAAGFDEVETLPLAAVTDLQGRAARGQGIVLARHAPATAALAAQTWLVCETDAGLGGALAVRLADAGAVVTRVAATPDDAGEQRVRAALASRRHWDGVLHCAGCARDRALDADALARRARQGAGSLLALAGAVASGESAMDRLYVLTRGAQAVDVHDADLDPAAAGLWGLARTIRLELPDSACRTLDLDTTASAHDVDAVLAWLTAPAAAIELAVRGGETRAPKLRPAPAATPALPPDYRLAAPASGSIDDLHFTAGERRAPGPGEVEIRVAASALNFKDVLSVLGMYPGDPGPLGSECAGVVTAVGPGVELAPGTPVVAAAGHAFGQHVLADVALVAPRPGGLSFAAAATLPVAYLTAHFALNHLARLQPGERVLIHAAAGGVGLAACALARRAGAEIFATAGSEQKRALLHAHGIAHVFDSRSGGFAEEILRATNGAGVDVVLNSLADELIDRSFAVIARAGRFLEIGKRGIWTPERVAALGRDIEYHIIDWGATHRENPALTGALLREVMGWVAAGELEPLPVTLFPIDRAADAFRFMAQGRHVGKVVLSHPVLTANQSLRFEPTASYLVTGGTAGLGLETARWAVEQGARTVVLAARGEPTAEARQAIEELRTSGAAVHVRSCDVGDARQVGELVSWMRTTLPPLRGVVHSAGTLAARTLQHATWADFDAVLRPKLHGPANLADATRDTPPDFFVAYSSIAGVLGSPGQANHATASAALDAFAATRWRDGTVGMSIAWGPWSETGAAVRQESLQRTSELGIGALTTRQGLERLAAALTLPEPLLVSMRVEDAQLLRSKNGGPTLEAVAAAAAPAATTAASADTRPAGRRNLPELLLEAPHRARRNLVLERVRERVRGVLGLAPAAALDAQRPLGELGMDSLLAVELRNALGNDAGRRLPATLLFDYPTVTALTDHLLSLLLPESSAVAGQTGSQAGDASPGDAVGALESLSDEDVDRMLAEKLSKED